MVRVLVRIFAVIGLLSVLLMGGGVLLLTGLASDRAALPEAVVLRLDLERPLRAAAADDPLEGLVTARGETLRDVVDALDRAAKDPRVKGLVARVGNNAQGIAATQELRAAVERFRQSGRFAYVHAETFGEFASGMQSYYLASGFEQVWMQPMGNVGITGILVTEGFYRGTLDKLGVVPQIGKRQEFKSAAEPYMETEATPANREMTESLVGDLFDQMVEGIAAGRGLDAAAVRQAVDRAPLLDREAVEAKLVDRLAYEDEMLAKAVAKAGPGAEEVELSRYAAAAGPLPPAPDAPVVALVTGAGAISRGRAEADPFGGGGGFGARDVVKAFDKAIEDKNVRAILFRVDSPGGSAVASEAVRRAVLRAKAAGKPVVVSMGDLAASGGYWVSMDADRIVAQPGTITGSIGVLGGKVVTTGLTEKLGIGYTLFSRGANAGMWSDKTPYDPAELARREAMLDDIYAKFTGLVAAGRDLPPEKVQQIARGRAWTGRQALELGLVDALGGAETALDQVRAAIGLQPGAPVRLVPFPRPRGRLELVMGLLGGGEEAQADGVGARAAALVLGEALEPYRPVLSQLEPLLAAARQEERVLMMPPPGLPGY